jgi:hypothetical protein
MTADVYPLQVLLLTLAGWVNRHQQQVMIIHCVFAESDGSYVYRPHLVDRLLAAGAWVNPTLYVSKTRIERMDDRRARGEAD